MLRKKYIKRMYIEEVYCDKCGSLMRPTGAVLMSWPEQYPYHCTNPECDGEEYFTGDTSPGRIKFEFEEENQCTE